MSSYCVGSRRLTAWLIAILLLIPFGLVEYFAAPISALAQSSGQKDERPTKPALKKSPGAQSDDDGILIKSDLVLLDVAVFDKDNHFVGDLTKENFQVYEDQVLQSIESCTREEAPVSLGFVIDTSGSMRAKLQTVVKAALYMTKSAKKGDEFFVVDFKEKAELVEEFTTRIADIQDALDNLIANSGTAMLDALAVSTEYAHKEGKNRRKAVIVMSDGDERDSFYKTKDLIQLMHEYDVQVYIVGFPDELPDSGGIFRKSQREKAVELISSLANETGGRAFFPQSLAELDEIARQINTDLRTQYTLSYTPTNDKADGTYRKISVKAVDPKRKLIVRTRAGYTAAKEDRR